MIYFLINNNYHFYDVKLHLKNLKDKEISLIQVPHTLNVIATDSNFVEIMAFEMLIRSKKDYINLVRLKRLHDSIRQRLSPSCNDVLFVYTEFELLNQYIIKYFKESKALVYLIEDGGFATYLTYSVLGEARLPLKEAIKLKYMQWVLSYNDTKFLYLSNNVFPQVSDHYIDGVLLYRDINIIRKIKKYIIHKEVELISAGDNDAVIFLNEKMYDHYLSFSEYVFVLNDILLNLSAIYTRVLFKFHPRENLELRSKIIGLIDNKANIEFLESNEPIENIILQYKVKNIASFFSAALLNLYDAGLNPIYVFHKYKIFMKHSVFVNVKKLLTENGFHLFENWEELKDSKNRVNHGQNNKFMLTDVIANK